MMWFPEEYLDMTMSKKIFGALGLALMALGMQLPASAQNIESQAMEVQAVESQSTELQSIEEQPVEGTEAFVSAQPVPSEPIEAASWTQPESLSADGLTTEAATLEQPAANNEAAELAYPAAEESADIAQARRRTRNAVRGTGSDFIGVGADFGTAGDVGFAVISKLSLRDQIAVRPSVTIGDGFAVLVPVTYDFSRYNTSVEGFQIRPYAGVGASYVDTDDSSGIGLLLTAGVDVPVARNFTANAQANYAGIFSDSDNFGVTVGVGYNFGGLIR